MDRKEASNYIKGRNRRDVNSVTIVTRLLYGAPFYGGGDTHWRPSASSLVPPQHCCRAKVFGSSWLSLPFWLEGLPKDVVYYFESDIMIHA